jgi:hypothetical protein
LNGQSLRRWRGKVESTIVRRGTGEIIRMSGCSSIYLRAAHSLFIAPPMNILSLIFILANNIINLSIFLSIISCVFDSLRSLPLLFSIYEWPLRTFCVGMQCVCFAVAVEINQYQLALPQKNSNKTKNISNPDLLTEKLNIYNSSRYKAQNFLVVTSF